MVGPSGHRWRAWAILAAAAVVSAAFAVVLARESGPIPVEDLGHHCSPGGDRLNPPGYFGLVTHIERFDSVTVAEAASVGETVATETDVTAILGATDRETVFSDRGNDVVERLRMGRELREESRRLPGGETVLVAMRPGHVPGEEWVQFVMVEVAAGDLVFVGNCAEVIRRSLEDYRDAVRPEESLVDAFLSVVADEAVWADFDAFDMREGKYAP